MRQVDGNKSMAELCFSGASRYSRSDGQIVIIKYKSIPMTNHEKNTDFTMDCLYYRFNYFPKFLYCTCLFRICRSRMSTCDHFDVMIGLYH